MPALNDLLKSLLLNDPSYSSDKPAENNYDVPKPKAEASGNPFSSLLDTSQLDGSIMGLLRSLGVGRQTPTPLPTPIPAPPSSDEYQTPPTSNKKAKGNKTKDAADNTNDVQPPIEPGNIDLSQRPVHNNGDGTISTVKSASFNIDGREVLLPTIAPDGTPLTDQQAVDLYRQTGKHLGIYANPASATAYAQAIHKQQESANRYAQPSALDPQAIEQLRQSLLTGAGQLDPNNPNGLAGRMSGPYSKLDQQGQKDEATSISDQFRHRNY